MAAGVFTVAWIPTGENIADAMTKRLSVIIRDFLFGNWAYYWSNHDDSTMTI